jgi:hypothetical protein
VGDIKVSETDSSGCCFVIQVLGRDYLLRADGKAQCKDWVITLNRIKEARLNQGNVKLVHPHDAGMMDPSDDMVAARVVVVANRERTRAMAESQDFVQLIRVDDNEITNQQLATYDLHHRRNMISNVVLARWTKRRSSLSRLGAKLANWARSITMYKCTDVEDVGVDLDRHVHPPGHDDNPSKRRIEKMDNHDPNQWIGKEISHTSADTSRVSMETSAPGLSSAKPVAPVRTMTEGSEDEARYIS